MKKPWTMTAKAGGELEILLYEVIGEDFWSGGGITAKQFAEDLKAVGTVSKIRLRVNSPGGNVFDGLAIFNTLLSHGATVTAQVDGLAASIASVIIMAASEISMGSNAMMMIHNPSTVIGGDSNDMRKMADTMDKVKTSMITAYRRHTGKSIEQIGALMDAETWWTAGETVDNGFAEKVITPEGDDAAVAAALRNPIVAKFFHPPARVAQIAARYAPGDDDERRRRSHLRTLELHDMQLAEHRAETLALHAQQLANMRARAVPEPSEDLQRRRILARNDRELREWRLEELAARGDGDTHEGRRRIQEERAREIAASQPATVGGGYLVPINSSMETNFTPRASEGATWV
ncbi:MAG: head maturation protease, ClpP-related [Candidatus Sulfotelmatobacter sp.]